MAEKLVFKLSGDKLLSRVGTETAVLRHDKASIIGIIAGIICLVLIGVVIALHLKTMPPEIPIFYNRPWGTARLMPSSWLWAILGINTIIVFVDTYIAAKTHAQEKLISRLLIWVGALVSFLLLITIYKILSIVA